MDVISEIAFGAPPGIIESGTDVGGMIKGFQIGLPALGIMGRLYPLTNRFKGTWVGRKYLTINLQDNSGLGILLKFRNSLIGQRMKDIEAGMKDERIDLLQRNMLNSYILGATGLLTAFKKYPGSPH